MAKLHLIGNSHIDPVWLWRWQEGFAEIIATYRSALDRMKEFPDFKFTSACAVYYEWIEKIDKDMFEEIRQRVQEGRWNIVGGWYLQPDCNAPCGESFARHGLISQRYFLEKFGTTAKTGYNVDSFGHNASIPKILKKSGMDNYVFMRPMPHEKEDAADIFRWESADGSAVTAYRIPHSYGLGAWSGLEDSLREIKERADQNGQPYMAFCGVGNHGGGPTIQMLDTISRMELPETVYSTPDEYFADIDWAKLPVVADELQHHARGCYSACSFVKSSNRKCENNLLAAEKLCVMAKHLAGWEYPEKKLRKAWKNLMFNQFHDIMGGCSIKKAYEDAGHLYGEIMSITEQEIYFAMQAVSRKINTLCGETLPAYRGSGNTSSWKNWVHEVLGTPVVVFNPHSWTVKMPVEINTTARKMTDDAGREIPFQIVRGDQTNGAADKYHTLFQAEVEPMGYAVYRFWLDQESEAQFAGCLSAADNVLENSRIRVEFSRLTGDICRLYDKAADRYLIDQECRAVLLDETADDTWAHDRVYLGEMTGMFDTPEFTVLENGGVRAALRVVTRYNGSILQRDFSITEDSPVVNVKVRVDFHEKHKTLKFTFPAASEEVTAQIPYGTISRQKGLGEEPCGAWIASGGLCVANDGKYGYDTTQTEMRLTILRSAIYADHFGVRDEHCEYMEQGIHECSYQVFPYTGSADAERRAGELNFGLRAVVESFHDGVLPERKQCLTCDGTNVVVTAVKQAEDGSGDIIRLCEMDGADGNISVKLFDNCIETKIAHNEIRTFRTDGTEVDLIEWEV